MPANGRWDLTRRLKGYIMGVTSPVGKVSRSHPNQTLIQRVLKLFKSTVLSLDTDRCILLMHCFRIPALLPSSNANITGTSLRKSYSQSQGPTSSIKYFFNRKIYIEQCPEIEECVWILRTIVKTYRITPAQCCKRSILWQYICCQAITFHLDSTYYKGRARRTVKSNVFLFCNISICLLP